MFVCLIWAMFNPVRSTGLSLAMVPPVAPITQDRQMACRLFPKQVFISVWPVVYVQACFGVTQAARRPPMA